METAVRRDRIRQIFTAAKNQLIAVAICSGEGEWSHEYFDILDIQEFTKGTENILVLVLRSSRNSTCFAVDVNCIYGLRFNKYLQLDGSLIDHVTVLSAETTLQVVRF